MLAPSVIVCPVPSRTSASRPGTDSQVPTAVSGMLVDVALGASTVKYEYLVHFHALAVSRIEKHAQLSNL